jgi:hypothetical protein
MGLELPRIVAIDSAGVALGDGRVLLARTGSACVLDLASPVPGPCFALQEASWELGAALLDDGRAVIAGLTGSAAIIDTMASSIQWAYQSVWPPYSTGWSVRTTVIPLPGAGALVVGGTEPRFVDTTANSVGTIPGDTALSGGCRLADGRVFVIGAGRAQIFDPASMTLGWLAFVPYQERPAVTCLPDGSVISATSRPDGTAGVLRIDGATGSFVEAGDLPGCSRGEGAACLGVISGRLAGGKTLFIYGAAGGQRAALYDDGAGTFQAVGRPNWTGEITTVVPLGDGRALVHGPSAQSPEIFTP